MVKRGTVNGGRREWILCDAKDKAALKLADEISDKIEEFSEIYCRTIKCETCVLNLACGFCLRQAGFELWDRADLENSGLCLYDIDEEMRQEAQARLNQKNRERGRI